MVSTETTLQGFNRDFYMYNITCRNIALRFSTVRRHAPSAQAAPRQTMAPSACKCNIYLSLSLSIYIYIHIYIHTCYISMCIYVYIYIYTYIIYIYIYIYMYSHN